MTLTMRTRALLVLLLLPPVLRAAAPSAQGLAFFESKVRPLLAEHCYECHSTRAGKIKGGLLLDSKAGWEKGGDSGEPIIVPGQPHDSLLIKSVRHDDPDLAMPAKAPKLPERAIADLIAWIAMGAPDPRTEATVAARRADKTWWSLQALADAEPPSPIGLPAAWAGNPVDRFIFAKLAEQGLSPGAPADARTLIRRMTYDLTGLPPTMEEVTAFSAEFSRDPAAATRHLADRLLASPRYGERWGRHWLDVVRFGESIGFERNDINDDLWPFRDYVIRAFNEDRAFSDVIVEHLAGDVVGKDNPAIEVGSAFLVAGPFDDVGNQDAVAQKNIRATNLDDVVTATSSAFLGLTVACARCQHHKFDPIPTEDYYRLRAAFDGVKHGRRVVATREERERFAAATRPLNEELAQLRAAQDALNDAIQTRAQAAASHLRPTRPKIDPALTEERFAPVAARHVKFVVRGLTNSYEPSPAQLKTPQRAPVIARLTGGRLTEFEVWTAGDPSRNAALAIHGGTATGAKSAVAEDFPEAYGPQLCIDGQSGEQWLIGAPAELTITLAQVETIDRITFSNAKWKSAKDQGATPCEYDVQVSFDGKIWRTVASDEGREPWTPAHALGRARRAVITAEEQAQLARLAGETAGVEKKIRAVPPLRQVWAGLFSEPAERTFVHKGGDPLKPGEPVAPSSLAVLDHVAQPYALAADAPEGQRRLALGRWLVRDDNPLPARVLANRVWHYHFGTGIVDTPGDFGFLGGRPTHPELLDWLAQRLRQNGWRLKPLHRDIVLSQSYRQSSAPRDAAARVDQDARLLWRFPPRRLGAEEVRDTLLSVAGKLVVEPAGGPGFRLYKVTRNNVSTYFPLDVHGPETYRRAVYHQNARASVADGLTDFDFPDIANPAPRRANTTTPLQALTLLNHRFTLDMAAALASRASEQAAAGDTAAFVAAAYRIALQRLPSPTEQAAATALLAKFGRAAFARALLNGNELIYLE
jgi:mono/diheme cytochrome c family protein